MIGGLEGAEEVFFEPPEEQEIEFADDPVLKDFMNLSNGAGRAIQTTQ